MKIAHLTSAHPRYDTRVFLKECRSLANSGFRVSLVVADGKGDELKDGVYIKDAGASNGRFDRIWNAPKRVLFEAFKVNADVYHLHDPELLQIVDALKSRGKKVIFDMHENLDLQILQKKWIPFILREPISFSYEIYERRVLRKIDGLVVPQNAMKTRFGHFARTEVIANFPEKFIDIGDNLGPRSKYKIIYAGGISEARGIFNMLNVIAELRKINQEYTLTLAGPVDHSLLKELHRHPAWKFVSYKGVLSADALYNEYKQHSIGFILFNNVGQYFMAYSLKLFEYMQNGMLVVMPDFGDWLDFNMTYDAGFCVDTRNSRSIAKKIDEIDIHYLNNVVQRNTSTVKEKFLWKSESEKLIAMYRQINGIDDDVK